MGEPRMRIRVYRDSSESDVYMDDVRQIDILDHEYAVYHGAFFTEFRPVAESRDVLEDVEGHPVTWREPDGQRLEGGRTVPTDR